MNTRTHTHRIRWAGIAAAVVLVGGLYIVLIGSVQAVHGDCVSINGMLVCDDPSDSVVNNRSFTGVVQGGAGNDVIVNQRGSTINRLDGGVGSDTLTNNGTVIGNLNSPGDDVYINNGVAGGIDGQAGNDSAQNNGIVIGTIHGGSGSDTLNNPGTAGAINGGDDSDLIMNQGTTSGVIGGGSGNDTIVNSGVAGGIDAGSGSDTTANLGTVTGGVTLGDGFDSFANSGLISGGVLCGAGDDLVTTSGTILGGGIACGDGNDTITVLGGIINGILDGGSGTNVLNLNFSVFVATNIEAEQLAVALSNAAGGTVTLNGVVYTWTNFAQLNNLLQISIGQFITVSIRDNRLNRYDLGAPVAIYCVDTTLSVYDINLESRGTFAFDAPQQTMIDGINLARSSGTPQFVTGGLDNVLYANPDGTLLVTAPTVREPETKTYSFLVANPCGAVSQPGTERP